MYSRLLWQGRINFKSSVSKHASLKEAFWLFAKQKLEKFSRKNFFSVINIIFLFLFGFVFFKNFLTYKVNVYTYSIWWYFWQHRALIFQAAALYHDWEKPILPNQKNNNLQQFVLKSNEINKSFEKCFLQEASKKNSSKHEQSNWLYGNKNK